MIVDASAIVAIIAGEVGHERLSNAIDIAPLRCTTPIAVYEVVAAIRRINSITVEDAARIVRVFLTEAGVDVAPLGPDTAWLALDAFARYGKGRGHPAQLNMGDCFAYAAAREAGVPLLFVGDDFGKTDIAGAL